MAHLIPFNKQFSSSAELVTLLRLRGLYIEDEKKADVDLCALGFPSGNWLDEPLWSSER